MHEKGLRVLGAFIESDGPANAETRGVDLEGCTITQDIALLACLFEDAPLLRSARLAGLFLNGSRFPGLGADRLFTTGGVFLQFVKSDGEIRLLGARIGGIISFTGAKLYNQCGNALNADEIETSGGIYLSDESNSNRSNKIEFESNGLIRLLGARIGGDLAIVGARLCEKCSGALDASGARIAGSLFLTQGTTVSGPITLIASDIRSIMDDIKCWPSRIQIYRCVYRAFTGKEWSAAERIAWLDKQDPAMGFRPQPWEQCAKVLRESGHAEDARAVLIAKEVRQRRARRQAATPLLWRWMLWIWDGLLGVTVRYGRSPMLAFAWLAAVWLVGAAVFWDAERTGALRPNDGGAIASAAWQGCAGAAPSRMACWQATPAGRDWPAFQPLAHSLDLTLPVIDLDMARWWTPDEGADWRWAAATRTWAWVQMGLGWFLSLLAVAGFSGIVKSD